MTMKYSNTSSEDSFQFLNFLKLLASNTGEELIYDTYSKQIGVSGNTIKTWVSALIKTAVICLVEPYNEESIAKRIVKRPKMYFFDTVLAAYLCGVDSADTLSRSLLKGRFFETFVYNEIRKSYMNEGIRHDFHYYRDTNQNEVDMVLVKDGKISLIEIKSGKSFNASSTKGFRQLEKTKLEKGRNAIICTSDRVSVLNDLSLLPISAI